MAYETTIQKTESRSKRLYLQIGIAVGIGLILANIAMLRTFIDLKFKRIEDNQLLVMETLVGASVDRCKLMAVIKDKDPQRCDQARLRGAGRTTP